MNLKKVRFVLQFFHTFTETPGLPTPIGVFRQVFKPTYDQALVAQIEDVKKKKGEGDLDKSSFWWKYVGS